jgi:outer membrane protein assembly factor BamB
MREMIFLLLVLLFNTVSGGDRWPDFRGPRTDGSSDATGLPLFWSEENNIKWKTAIHDRGWSSPVILDGKIWLTTAKENGTAFYVLCVNFDDGKILHDIEVFTASDPQRINDLNSYATPSPVVEQNDMEPPGSELQSSAGTGFVAFFVREPRDPPSRGY